MTSTRATRGGASLLADVDRGGRGLPRPTKRRAHEESWKAHRRDDPVRVARRPPVRSHAARRPVRELARAAGFCDEASEGGGREDARGVLFQAPALPSCVTSTQEVWFWVV